MGSEMWVKKWDIGCENKISLPTSNTLSHFPHLITSLLTSVLLVMFSAGVAVCDEEVHYKKFNLEKAACDVGLLYRATDQGMDIGVSAITVGMGADFRKWKITGIRLSIAGDKFLPRATNKFYVTKESFFRVPAAILFAAIGTQINVGGAGLEQGIGKTGAALGLGLLVLQARGEITGETSVFHLSKELSEKITKTDAIEIMVEHEGLHLKYKIKIGIVKSPSEKKSRFDYEHMTQVELARLIDTLKAQSSALEKSQASYKYGTDPEYDEIQHRIESLETERGIAYRIWLKKGMKLT